MKLKTFFFNCAAVALLAAGTVHLRAQSLEPFNPYGIFSPSVEAWQMTRYGNLTPSLYTGAMTFSLPLYTYEDPDFTIPISLEYSFDGYRPAQHSGTVGYGWYLNCGGVITREVRGVPDEGVFIEPGQYYCRIRGWFDTPNSYHGSFTNDSAPLYSIHRFDVDSPPASDAYQWHLKYDPFADTPMMTYYNGAQGYYLYDPAPDIWHFNFLGHTGDFMAMADGTFQVFNSDLPSGEVSVCLNTGRDPNYPPSTKFIISTGDGTDYTFSCDGVDQSTDDESYYVSDPSHSITSWHLERIDAPNKRYVEFNTISVQDLTCITRYDNIRHGSCTDESPDSSLESSSMDINVQPDLHHTVIQGNRAAISGISVREPSETVSASIEFTYRRDGSEFDGSCFEYDEATLLLSAIGKNLHSMDVINSNRDTVERWTFGYRSPDAGVGKLFLESANGRRSGEWHFSYDLQGRTLPKNDTQGTDHWGFWNGADISDLRQHLRLPGFRVVEPGYTEILPDSTEVVHPPVLEQITVEHLFEQMSDSAKEADEYFARCGALTQITYPTGGSTTIEYEGNRSRRRMNIYETTGLVTLETEDSLRSAGGIRVKRISDRDGTGKLRERLYSYEDATGLCSGVLMQMPRYLEDCWYNHIVPLSCSATIYVTSFSNACSSVLGRNPHVVYTSVKETNADGSNTSRDFINNADTDCHDQLVPGIPVAKKILGNSDIFYEVAMPRPKQVIWMDRQALRGKLRREVCRNSAGTVVKEVEYSYALDTLSIPAMYHNSAYKYIYAPFNIVSPLTESITSTLHGVTEKTEYRYNGMGQVVREEIISGVGPVADTIRTDYTYLHESDSTTRLVSALSSATRSKVRNGVVTPLISEEYTYEQWPSLKNPRPTLIRRRIPDTGAVRETTITYNSDFLPSQICMPGGAMITYIWDGNNLQTRTDNGASNTTSFVWKDLVGPTLITAPSGEKTGYMYDSHSRLQAVSDGLGDTVIEYNYKLTDE